MSSAKDTHSSQPATKKKSDKGKKQVASASNLHLQQTTRIPRPQPKPRSDHAPRSIPPWACIVGGLVLSLAVILVGFPGLRCLIKYQVTESVTGLLVPIVTFIVTGLGSLILNRTGKTQVGTCLQSFTLAGAAVVFGGILTATVLPALPHGFCDPSVCPAYSHETGQQEIALLIEREEEAVLSRNLDLIDAIFTSDAEVMDDRVQRPQNAIAHYTNKFEMEFHCLAEHYNIYTFDQTETSTQINSSSRGTWRPASETGACTQTYENVSRDADHWFMVQDTDDCWRIERFTFNNDHPFDD